MARELLLATGLILGALGYLSLAWYVWLHRAAAGARGLIGILISVLDWTTCYALEVTSRTVDDAELWSTLKYIGVVGLPPSLLVFAVEYTGRRGLGRRAVALLAVVPVLTVASLVVPATRDLIHSYDPWQRTAGELPEAPVPSTGPLFWPHAVYNYSLAFFALGLTVYRLLGAGKAYRRQAYVVSAAALVPLLANIGYNAGLFGPEATDPVPFGFTVLAVVLVWGFFRQELLDLVPVARDTVIEQMADGVLVLDVHDRVVDANPAAAALLRMRVPDLVGRALPDLVPAARPLLAGGPGRADVTLPAAPAAPAPPAAPAAPGEGRDVALTVTPLVLHGAEAGRLVLLHDVTERQAAQRRLRDLLDEQTRLAGTLAASLRPRSLPEVPGVQLAVRSLPAAPGEHVNGDFYDIHRVRGGDWAFAVGDVSGKGVEAAVLTSMARYTVRTLSAEGHGPRHVLEQLNRALLADESPERFCTLAYGRLDGADLLGLDDADGLARGVQLTLAIGGHPRPLVRRRSGVVEPVGRVGTALGLLASVDVEEVAVRLESGDVLLLYTDGVVEARHGTEQFGEERLADVLASSATGLRGRTGVSAAHLVAQAVAERVLTEVTDWASRREDLAVLVVAVP